MKQEKQRKKMSKRVLLHTLLKNNDPVWVKNKSATLRKNKTGEPGPIVFKVGHGDDAYRETIPPGPDPICLTDRVDPESLKSCRDLFKLIQDGALELLDPEKADQYYEENEERMAIIEEKIDKYTNMIPDSDDKPKPVSKSTEKILNLNKKVGDICLKARHEAIKERDALESLIEISECFSEADYAYIASNGHYQGLKSWAKDQLSKLGQEPEKE